MIGRAARELTATRGRTLVWLCRSTLALQGAKSACDEPMAQRFARWERVSCIELRGLSFALSHCPSPWSSPRPFRRRAADKGWTSLIGDHELDAWRKPTGTWFVAGDARPDPSDPTRLAGVPGRGVIINGPGKTRNLYSKEDYGDLEAHFEFLIPRDSNSGVKLQGLYEIQICDSASAPEADGQRLRRRLSPGRAAPTVSSPRRRLRPEGQRARAGRRVADARSRLQGPPVRRRRARRSPMPGS